MKLLTRYKLTFAKVDSEKGGREGGRRRREGGEGEREGGRRRREGGEGGREGGDQVRQPVTQYVLSCSV